MRAVAGSTTATRISKCFRSLAWAWALAFALSESLLAVSILLGVSFSTSSYSQEEPKRLQSIEVASEKVGRKKEIVLQSDGSKMVHVRWAIGSRDHIVTLRIPFAYVPILGGEELPDSFAAAFVVEAMLWDMAPVPRRRLSRSEGSQLVRALVESSFAGGTTRSDSQQLQTRAKNRLADVKRNYYQLHYHLKIIQKSERFGLKRIGAVHSLGDETPVGLTDFYYLGDDPEQSSDFMTCTDDAVPDDAQPGKYLNPGCQQWFALPTLSATVKLTYRRRHLSEWREIKRRVIDLLESSK